MNIAKKLVLFSVIVIFNACGGAEETPDFCECIKIARESGRTVKASPDEGASDKEIKACTRYMNSLSKKEAAEKLKECETD